MSPSIRKEKRVLTKMRSDDDVTMTMTCKLRLASEELYKIPKTERVKIRQKYSTLHTPTQSCGELEISWPFFPNWCPFFRVPFFRSLFFRVPFFRVPFFLDSFCMHACILFH